MSLLLPAWALTQTLNGIKCVTEEKDNSKNKKKKPACWRMKKRWAIPCVGSSSPPAMELVCCYLLWSTLNQMLLPSGAGPRSTLVDKLTTPIEVSTGLVYISLFFYCAVYFYTPNQSSVCLHVDICGFWQTNRFWTATFKKRNQRRGDN